MKIVQSYLNISQSGFGMYFYTLRLYVIVSLDIKLKQKIRRVYPVT
jgi:hypothetical protein